MTSYQEARSQDRAPRRVRKKYHSTGRRYAALDLGTNNCRLLVADTRKGGIRVVDSFSRIVRLGEGLGERGFLGEAAMERTLSALEVCQQKLDFHKISRMRLITTQACRLARNGDEFLERIENEIGLKLEVIDYRTEARLAAAGCASLIDKKSDGAIIFDIGGGSTEIIWVDLQGSHGSYYNVMRSIRQWMSVPVGVVTLAEKFGGQSIDEDCWRRMVGFVREQLQDFPHIDLLSRAISERNIHLLGASGTVTTLAGVHLGLKRYDRRKVDGSWLDESDLRSLLGYIQTMSFDERVNNPCIGSERADLVIGGCAILEAIFNTWPCSKIRVADRGLREGILMELMYQDRPRGKFRYSGRP